MKRIFLVALFALISVSAFAQAKKPTIMVVPSDAWCKSKGYVTEIDNMGTKVVSPDYVTALQSDFELLNVIAKLNDLMFDRGFPLQNLESVIKDITTTSTELSLVEGKNGGTVAETMYDQVRNRARADIIMQVTWDVVTVGPKKSVRYTLQGLDSYTNKQIAGASGTGDPSHEVDVALMLQEAVLANMDSFVARLQEHFDDMFANGREVSFLIRISNLWENDLESDYDGYALCEVLDDWFYDNTVNHRYSIIDQTETMMNIGQVRMPLYDERGRALDANRYIRNLVRFLREEPYGITDIKILNQGLGRCVLILGEK
ncbi:MAG: hypothetical protein IJZ78_03245 [Alistipes sp.]|nr:hypothetical protein [Alistipes sp.]